MTFPVLLLLPLNLPAECPISQNGTLEVRAPAGNVELVTTGTDSVAAEISGQQVTLQEVCAPNTVTLSATMPNVVGIPDWKIRVPRTITLDVSTQGGNIQIGDTDGPEARLRTSGGKVTTGNIKGNVLIVASEVRAGNIGGNAEIRGSGGKLEVGNVGGNAEFFTTGGDILTGRVRGHVKADTGSGSVTIRESNGDVIVTTQEGNITSDYVHGSFDGRTDNGNIRIERVGSWVHAMTGVGDIFFRLIPENLAGDLHVEAESALGNITMYLPNKLKATIDAVIDKPAFNGKRIFSDFPLRAPTALRSLIPGGPEQQRGTINSGGNAIKAHTSVGTINILSLENH